MIKADLKRMLSSWQFYVAIAGGFALITNPIWLQPEIWSSSTPLSLFSLAMGISDFTPFAVIFAVLPYGASFCEDCRTEYSNHIVSRIGFQTYIRGRWASVALSGAITMGIIMVGTILFCLLAAGIPETAESTYFLNGGPWAVGGLPLKMGGLWFYLLRIALAMIFGAIWGTVGLIFSAAFTNPYIAVVLPFVVYQMLWYLFGVSKWNPLYYFRADLVIPSLRFAFTHQLVWLGVISVIAQILMKRRLTK